MSKHSWRNRLLAGAIVAGVVLAIPATAMAATPSSGSGTSSHSPLYPVTQNSSTFNVAKQWVEHQLTLRQQRLSNLTTEVAKAKDLSSSDRSTLQTDLSNETAGINSLAAKVPNDTTWAELRADAKSMVVDYRVFVVMSPQVHLTIAADAVSTVESKLQAAEPQIESLIQYEQSKGKDVHAAQVAYEAMVVEVNGAEHDTNGISSVVLAQTPAGYPANETVFLTAKSNLQQAGTALQSARTDLHTIAKVLGV